MFISDLFVLFLFDNEWILCKNLWDLIAKVIAEATDEIPLSGNECKKVMRILCLANGLESNLLAEYSAGHISSEEFYGPVSRAFGVDQQVVMKALSHLIGESDRDAIDTVKRLKGLGHRVAILSNTNAESYKGMMSKHDYFKFFD